MLTKSNGRRKNSNTEIRNPKQYQNPNDQNSKQMRYGAVVFRLCH